MKTIGKVTVLSVGALALAACDSGTTTPDQTTSIRPAIHVDPPIAVSGDATWEALDICKVWDGSSNGLLTDFEVTVGNDVNSGGATTTRTVSGLADGDCVRVALFDGRNPASVLRVVETVPAGAELVDVSFDTDFRPGSGVTDATIAPYNARVTSGVFEVDFADNNVGFAVTFTNRLLPTGGGEGCTPGFWKNHAGPDSFSKGGQKKPSEWVTYAPGDDFDAVFGVASSFGGSLMDALTREGGDEAALGRHAVAALLNAASSVSYDLSEADVIALVQDAYASGDFEGAKNTLAALNEQGCPL